MSSPNPTRLTVVIPTFNRRDLVGRALDSVIKQTCLPNEVIVVDDGSTDGTADQLKKLYPEVRVIIQDNQGVSAARNAGIQAARSDWIAFLDSDDVWLPNKLEKQLSALADNPDYRICHTEERWIFRGKERTVATAYRKKGGWIFENCLKVCAISPSTVMIRKDLFDEVGLFDEALPACEDYDLWLRIASRYPVLLVDEPLIEKQGGHSDQLSDQRGLDRFRIKALRKLLCSEGLSTEYRRKAVATLVSKCTVFAKGAEKRGRLEEAEEYRELAGKANEGLLKPLNKKEDLSE